LPYKTSAKLSSHQNRENTFFFNKKSASKKENFESGSSSSNNVIPNGNGPVVHAMILDDIPAPDKNILKDIKTLLEIVGIRSRLWGWIVNNIGVGAVFEVALYSSALFSLVSLVYIRWRVPS
jgi:hypothetical protein